jgi:4-hydroxybenzoate polyprenyltransferase
MASGTIVVPPPSRAGWFWDIVKVCRPHQWSKNVFVFAPLLFSQRFTHAHSLIESLLASGCFCLISSAVYVFNDLLDAEADRLHLRKRNRPIAAGRISSIQAVSLIVILIISATITSLALFPVEFMALAGVYIANSVLYCLWIKHKVIADVMSIAAGFVLRLLAGCAAIAVTPTSWIIVCGFSLALVLGFGKRRLEVAQEIGTDHRASLQSYSPAKLDTLLAISTAVCLLSYMIYTVAPDTVQRHRTGNLIYTIPVVAYGLFRYLFKAQEGKGGDGPAEILLSDWVFLATGLLWGLAVALILLLA